MPKSEKGDNSAKYLQNFAKRYSGHLHFGNSLYAKYIYPCATGSPDILFTGFTMQKLKKGHNAAMTNSTEKK